MFPPTACAVVASLSRTSLGAAQGAFLVRLEPTPTLACMVTEHGRRIDEISSRGKLSSGRAAAHLLRTAVDGADGEAGEAAKEAATAARLASHAAGRATGLLERLETAGGHRRNELALALAHLCLHAYAMEPVGRCWGGCPPMSGDDGDSPSSSGIAGGLRRPVNNTRGKPLILTVAQATWGKPR